MAMMQNTIFCIITTFITPPLRGHINVKRLLKRGVHYDTEIAKICDL